MVKEGSAEATIRGFRRKTQRKVSAEEKTRIVVEGLRGGQPANPNYLNSLIPL